MPLLALFSKFPQSTQNYRASCTGKLSVFAAWLLITTQEVNDPLVAAGFALVLNLVVSM